MNADGRSLKQQLTEAGLSNPMIEAAWPAWWSDELDGSASAGAELRFSVARKLGLSPKSLFDGDVEFVWTDEARFKHLSNETDQEKLALTSFGVSIGNKLIETVESKTTPIISALSLRQAILKTNPYVDLKSLLATCWAIGVPVIHLRLFPLHAKRMHAMAVRIKERFAILLGRDASYPAPLAFTLAHEIGHIMCGHLTSSSAIIDIGDSFEINDQDQEEMEADQFALELLLGTANPDIQTSLETFNAAQLAQAVVDNGPRYQIEPGTLALCLAYRRGLWALANAAMSHIYAEKKPVWTQVNQVAAINMQIESLGGDSAEFMRKVMGANDA